MTSKATAAILFALAAIAPQAAQAASIVYAINPSSTTPEVSGELTPLSDTVLGTITTNGTLGLLHTADIIDWNIQLIDNVRPASNFVLTPANSAIWYFTDLGLTATPTGLSFNFSDAGAGFLIQGDVTHGLSSGYNYFCYQATSGACLQGETIVPDYYGTDGTLVGGLSGTLPLNGAVPEPATWTMMLAGFAVVGYAMRRKPLQAVRYAFG